MENSAPAVQGALFPLRSFISLPNFSIRAEVGLLSKNIFASICKSKPGNIRSINTPKATCFPKTISIIAVLWNSGLDNLIFRADKNGSIFPARPVVRLICFGSARSGRERHVGGLSAGKTGGTGSPTRSPVEGRHGAFRLGRRGC